MSFFFRKYYENYGIKRLYISNNFNFMIISIEDKPFFIFNTGTILLMLASLDKKYILDIFEKEVRNIYDIFFSKFLCICFYRL